MSFPTLPLTCIQWNSDWLAQELNRAIVQKVAKKFNQWS